MRKKVFLFILIFVAIMYSYYTISRAFNYENSKITKNEEYKIYNIEIYKDTPAWELALAVRDEKTKTIEKIVKDKQELLNYQEPKYGATLLLWAVGTEKYESVETLLKCGADPDIATTTEGETPLFRAAGYSWVDKKFEKDPKYVKPILSYGADPNKNYIGHNRGIIESGTSPLMNSIGCGIEKTKALVEGGVDINYKTKSGHTAAINALDNAGPTSTLEAMQYSYCLIVEKKAKVNEPYYSTENNRMPDDDPNVKFYPVNILRNCTKELGSEEYKIKMQIVDEFVRQGVNYWDTKIPEYTLEQIKEVYPDTWEEYIKKY